MSLLGWLQIAATLALVLAVILPLGRFMARLFMGERTFLHPVLSPVERGFYRAAGIDPEREQGWFAYTMAMLVFSALGFISLYLILRLQGVLPFNPSGLPGVAPDLAFNTAISFLTNTNWQAYSGESTMSNFSQMAGLAVHNFLSAATGIALAIAVTRAFARSGAATLGNFWVDLTRATLYVLLPLSVVVALAMVALEGEVAVHARNEGDQVVISVTDEGPGIRPADLERVFEKFYRGGGTDRRKPGTGLGLSICKGLVQAMGGTIQAESPAARRRGTRLIVRLPAAELPPDDGSAR